jgi:ABC-type sulfate/molybdate transport systems ATPase subunit
MPIEIIMQASNIPNGSRVKKVRGDMEHILLNEIRFFKNSKCSNVQCPKSVYPDPGSVFIMSINGNVSVIEEDCCLRLCFNNKHEAIEFIERM